MFRNRRRNVNARRNSILSSSPAHGTIFPPIAATGGCGRDDEFVEFGRTRPVVRARSSESRLQPLFMPSDKDKERGAVKKDGVAADRAESQRRTKPETSIRARLDTRQKVRNSLPSSLLVVAYRRRRRLLVSPSRAVREKVTEIVKNVAFLLAIVRISGYI